MIVAEDGVTSLRYYVAIMRQVPPADLPPPPPAAQGPVQPPLTELLGQLSTNVRLWHRFRAAACFLALELLQDMSGCRFDELAPLQSPAVETRAVVLLAELPKVGELPVYRDLRFSDTNFWM